jgi:FAD-linked sulfhydryl oxidase
MDANIWGSHAWLFLHTVTLNYPENPNEFDKKHYKDFFESLSHVIPCEVCKNHYKKNIKKYPIKLESRESLTRWLHKIHNLVNIKNGKEEYPYDKFIEKYSELYSTNKGSKTIFMILIIILIGLGFYFYKNKK